MSDSSWEFLRIEKKQIKTVQKLAWNYLFLSRSNKQETTIKGKTWSRYTIDFAGGFFLTKHNNTG